MLTCLPKSLCSWDYRVLGAEAGPAELLFNWFSEQGTIRLGGDEFEVVKHGPLSGHWTLENGGQVIASGQKPSAMFRAYELSMTGVDFTVQPQSAFTRCFDIVFEGRVVGSIRPAHIFTRRAFIECNSQVPELVQLFAFWLTAIAWRRAMKNNN
jgi:hypothetical protein